MTPYRVEAHLANWADWMRSGTGVRGYASHTPGIVSGGLHSFEDLADQCDKHAARVTDASIQDLPGIEQAAVSHYHLAAVWRFNRETAEIVYDRAVDELTVVLSAKGLV